MIADTPSEFVSSTVRLLSDQYLKDRITKNARKLICEQYTWDKCSGQYEKHYMNILNKSRKSEKL
jgi:glycosyltransferase involved in cell wall biosynthesis